MQMLLYILLYDPRLDARQREIAGHHNRSAGTLFDHIESLRDVATIREKCLKNNKYNGEQR
jgi:hypothetical protein